MSNFAQHLIALAAKIKDVRNHPGDDAFVHAILLPNGKTLVGSWLGAKGVDGLGRLRVAAWSLFGIPRSQQCLGWIVGTDADTQTMNIHFGTPDAVAEERDQSDLRDGEKGYLSKMNYDTSRAGRVNLQVKETDILWVN